MENIDLEIFNDYCVVENRCGQNIHHASKIDAADHNGLTFNHYFYFSWCEGRENANCKVNGRCARYDPKDRHCGWGSEFYYQASDKDDRVIISSDMKKFYEVEKKDYYSIVEIEL